MSDFGTMIVMRQRSGSTPTATERQWIEAVVADFRGSTALRDAAGEPLRFRIVPSARPGSVEEDLAVVLSEYWSEGVDEGEYDQPIDAMLEQDRRTAVAVRDALRKSIGDGYAMEIVWGAW